MGVTTGTHTTPIHEYIDDLTFTFEVSKSVIPGLQANRAGQKDRQCLYTLPTASAVHVPYILGGWEKSGRRQRKREAQPTQPHTPVARHGRAGCCYTHIKVCSRRGGWRMEVEGW